ncbi:MFS transporter [Aestuariibius sp. HNIBRBA575]|uniref:MFS transporter n=1 Tax=Aestuariibius sp. HNIBRBA575 TaxID=3233343 RepID=UPI0034A336A3
MFKTLTLLWGDPALRIASAAVFLFGCLVASIAPFMSVLAIERFGLSDAGYGALLLVSSVVAVLGSIGIGILTDQTAARRKIIQFTIGLALFGNILVWCWPSKGTFIAAHGFIIPLASTLFGQVFVLARLASQRFEPAHRDGILSAVRALFAVPFVVILPLWAVALRQGIDLLHVYFVIILCCLAMLLLFLFFWPDGAGWNEGKSGQGFGASLGEVVNPKVLTRLAATGAINAGSIMYMIVLGLSFEQLPNRDLGDVALFAGIVAGLEVPVMLSMGLILRHITRLQAIMLGAAIHGGFMISFPFAAASPSVWIMTIPLALGHGIILTLPLAYLQDLMGARAGAGGALISLQKVAADGISAALFAAATWLAGYGLAAALAGGATILGALSLIWLDAKQSR